MQNKNGQGGPIINSFIACSTLAVATIALIQGDNPLATGSNHGLSYSVGLCLPPRWGLVHLRYFHLVQRERRKMKDKVTETGLLKEVSIFSAHSKDPGWSP